MKKYLYYAIGVMAFVALATSCQKSKISTFEPTQGLTIYKAQYDDFADSTNYSFATKNTSIVEDTIWIPVRIIGNTKDYDRTIDFEAIDSLTSAQAGKHYDLLTPYKIPAGSFTSELGVVVKRSPDLSDTTVRLTLQLKPNEAFPHILDRHADYLITINNILTKPANWDTRLISYFGDYSDTKYRFIIDVLKRADFPVGPGGLEIAEIMAYQATMQIALKEYNDAHPGDPLRDENGNKITF